MANNNVLLVHPSNELYGADRSLLRLARSLDKDQYAPFVIVANDLPYEGLLTQELTRSGIPSAEVNLGVLRRQYRNPTGIMKFGYRTLASARSIADYCQEKRIDVIHTNSTAVIAPGIAARRTGLPHFWHVREIITQPAWLNKLISGSLNRYADTVIAVSGPVKENLLKAQPALESKCVVVHNGIDPQDFLSVPPAERDRLRQSWGASADTVVVGMVGRISAWKGQEFFLEAASHVAEAGQDVRFVLVGGTVLGEEGRKQALEQQAEDLGLANHVVIDDFRLDVPAVMAAFDVFVLPSTRPDPFPTVVLEAMAAGKPVLATAHGGALEQVNVPETGLLVSPTDVSELVAAMRQLVQNPEQRLAMGQAGRARLLAHFTTDRYVRDIQELYARALTRP